MNNKTASFSLLKIKNFRLIFIFVLVLAQFFSFYQSVSANEEALLPEVKIVQDINPGGAASKPQELVMIGDLLFFKADDGLYGEEIWLSRPPYTAEDTVRITDINPGQGSASPTGLVVLGDVLFFQANNGKNGCELWRLEPPYQQAVQIIDINPGKGNSYPRNFANVGNTLFFQAGSGQGQELWKVSPPYNEAMLVKDIWKGAFGSNPEQLQSIGWVLFFTAEDDSGRELWKSTPPYDSGSTVRVKDIMSNGSSNPRELTVVGDILFFTADDKTNGRELWKSEVPYDFQTTVLANDIKHLYPSKPYNLKAINDILFFTSSIGESGYELRKIYPPYDSISTSPVADIISGETLDLNSSWPDRKTGIGSTLFFTAWKKNWGVELWLSEPPYRQARLVKDIHLGTKSSNPDNLIVMGTTLYFTADDGEKGRELWKSTPPYDGKNTVLVKDLYSGKGSSNPVHLLVRNRNLFFNANNGKSGAELWKIAYDVTHLPNSSFAPDRFTKQDRHQVNMPDSESTDLTLLIPMLGIKTNVTGVPATGDNWDITWLGHQVGYLYGTAYPTHPGNSVIVGHSNLMDGTQGPFAQLKNLKWGDKIEIMLGDEHYSYEVRENLSVAADDLSPMKTETLTWLTLITCEDFDEEKNLYTHRRVVRAVLVKTGN